MGEDAGAVARGGESTRPVAGVYRISTSDDAYGESYTWQVLPSGVVHILPGARVTGPRLSRLGGACLIGAVVLAYGARLLDSEALRHMLLGVAACTAAVVLVGCLGAEILARATAVRSIVTSSCICLVLPFKTVRYPTERIAKLVISSSSVEGMIRAERHVLVAVLKSGRRIELVDPGPTGDIEELRRLKGYLRELLSLPAG